MSNQPDNLDIENQSNFKTLVRSLKLVILMIFMRFTMMTGNNRATLLAGRTIITIRY